MEVCSWLNRHVQMKVAH